MVPPKTDAAALDDVGAVADQPREMQVLLGDDDADAFLLHGQDGVDHLLDDLRRQPFRGLVEQHQRRIAHQRARDGQHLLLAAAHAPARAVAHLAEIGKQREQLFAGPVRRVRPRGWRPTSRFSSTVRSVKMRRSSGT
jgi:hypothetical protein